MSLRGLRDKEFIVFDLSENGGGSSIWQKPLLRNLWGDRYLRSLGDMHTYNQEWSKKFRISDENLRHLKKLKYHSSIREKNKDFDIVNFDIYSQKENLYSNEDDTLVSAKVFVLTDSLCASSCWLNVREFLQVPGIVHIGKTTAIQTLYSEVRGITLPSKNFTFVFPIHQFLSPLNNLYF